MNKTLRKSNYKEIIGGKVFKKKGNSQFKRKIMQKDIELLIAQYYLNRMSDIPIMNIVNYLSFVQT